VDKNYRLGSPAPSNYFLHRSALLATFEQSSFAQWPFAPEKLHCPGIIREFPVSLNELSQAVLAVVATNFHGTLVFYQRTDFDWG